MKEIKIEEFNINPIYKFAKEWALISAGDPTSYNTMTASWGGFGSLWGHGGGMPVTTIYIRPQRYTKQFVDTHDYYSLCFFDESYKKALGYLGSHSGKDEDKIAKVGLSVDFIDDVPYFKEAKMVVICRKLYQQTMLEECFIDKNVMEDSYPNKDFHDMYIGEIMKIFSND